MSENTSLQSFVETAAKSPFPIQNLPYGIFSTSNHHDPRSGVAIGDKVLDLAVLENDGLLPKADNPLHSTGSLNAFGEQGKKFWLQTRETLQNLLSCLLYTSPSPRDQRGSRMPSSA